MTNQYFVSGYWNNNLGDDLFLYILCNRYSKVSFVIYCDESNSKVFSQIPNLKIIKKTIVHKLFNKAMTILEGNSYEAKYLIPRYNNYIEIGGSIFIQNTKWKRVLNNRKFIRERVENYFVIGSNFGPFSDENFKEDYSSFFATTQNVFRDSQSSLYFPKLDIPYKSDVIFSLNFSKTKKVLNNPYYLISVIDFRSRNTNQDEGFKKTIDAYESKIVEIINHVTSKLDVDVMLMNFCINEGDGEASKRIYERLSTSVRGKVSVKTHNEIWDSCNTIANADKIIATRFHANILGWLFKKPVLSISYSNKLENFINSYLGKNFKFYLLEDFINLEMKDFNSAFNVVPQNIVDGLIKESSEQFTFLDLAIKKNGRNSIKDK